ncbi:pentatricopeptide repeat-containing protein At2g03880, mitochondrial-like [Phragmites australis]|uniref:pentatricopeptide repeat-containing protein At2g03880, mitochondrial-like n=1 Tax=Phragmites australis TaxID=29695 RepID=UPI002D79D679|nr:pentatricopeptide repeat-containing protein At2g03880, mitochondrial-like [Phragmites australis]
MASPAGMGLVAYNAAISRCARAGLYPRALALFREMRGRGLRADEYTLPPLLNSAALLRAPPATCALHALLLRAGLAAHLHVANALVDAYAKLSRPDAARAVFDEMPSRDVVTWTSLLTGLARAGDHDAAVCVYHDMVAAGVQPDEFVVAAVLSSCAGSTMLELGRSVHAAAVQLGFEPFLSVGNSLVSMYAKTGSLRDARMVFDAMRARCTITWTALIVGYAQNGCGKQSLEIYTDMVRSGCRPDYVTFIGLLFACSHAGLVDAGRAHFRSMETDYGIVPGPDHYACMADLLGRAGRLEEAMDLLNRSSTKLDATVWKALLGACRVHRNAELAERASEMVWRLDPTDAVPYVMLSNLYSRARRWGDVARIRALMKSRGITKEPGCSWVGVNGVTHLFHVADRGHPRTAEIYRKVEEMTERIRAEGYVPDTDWALQDEAPEGRERGLAYHSERLAVAFGLLAMPATAPIRVFKNLRVCGDCHAAIKMVAKAYGREIILRDANCFHHMKDGICSCGGYW